MSTIETKTGISSIKPTRKSAYTTPRLMVYGSVATLTAGGSVNKTENNGHPDGFG